MARPRYVVQTVSGYPIHAAGRAGFSGTAKPGLSAHVCDTLYLYEVVATYRSTDSTTGHGPGRRRGVDGALAAAEAHAERLNRDTA